MNNEQKTPRTEGFTFPAEWEKHTRTWLTYPKPNESWPDNFPEVCMEYNEFIRLLSLGEEVHIITDNRFHSTSIAEALYKIGSELQQINFHEFGSDDCWCRDHGPSFLLNRQTNEQALVKWEFNAWGNKYNSQADNQIGNKIADFCGYKTYRPGIIMEGGSVEVNGNGTLLTTRACLLNKNRNSKSEVTEIEYYLREYYNVDNIIWLNEGVEGDDTDGHIDDIARFVNPETIIFVNESNSSDSNSDILTKNLEILKKSRLENGKQPELIEIPMPKPVYAGKYRLPASYANFYISNQAIIVPIFGSKKDEIAMKILQECFPERKIEALPARNIIYGLGSWHCLSQQQPSL